MNISSGLKSISISTPNYWAWNVGKKSDNQIGATGITVAGPLAVWSDNGHICHCDSIIVPLPRDCDPHILIASPVARKIATIIKRADFDVFPRSVQIHMPSRSWRELSELMLKLTSDDYWRSLSVTLLDNNESTNIGPVSGVSFINHFDSVSAVIKCGSGTSALLSFSRDGITEHPGWAAPYNPPESFDPAVATEKINALASYLADCQMVYRNGTPIYFVTPKSVHYISGGEWTTTDPQRTARIISGLFTVYERN